MNASGLRGCATAACAMAALLLAGAASPAAARHARFPAVTGAEIRAAVRRAGGGRDWLKLVRGVRGPHDSPVGVSKVSFRVKVREGGRWRVVNTFHFTVPMGC